MDDVVYVNASATPCTTHKIPIADKSFVYQVRVCRVQDATYVVVASENGVEVSRWTHKPLSLLWEVFPKLYHTFFKKTFAQVFDENGEHAVYSIVLKDVIDEPEEGWHRCALGLDTELMRSRLTGFD